MFAGVAIPAFVVWMFPATFSRAIPFIQTVAGSLLEDSESARQMYGIAFGGITLFFVGLADDRWGLSWKLRLGLQVVVAFAVTQAGVRATVFVAQPWIGIGITML